MATSRGLFRNEICLLKACWLSRFVAMVVLAMPAYLGAAEPNKIHAGLECQQVVGKGGNTSTICVQNIPAFGPKDSVALVFSAFALMMSIGSLYYTYKRDRSQVSRSIHDEFWTREILGPHCIEPLVKELSATITQLPASCDSASWDKAELDRFGKGFQGRKKELVSSCEALAILDVAVCKDVLNHLDAAEDSVIEYVVNNMLERRDANGTSTMPRETTQQALRAALVAIGRRVKDYQLSQH